MNVIVIKDTHNVGIKSMCNQLIMSILQISMSVIMEGTCVILVLPVITSLEGIYVIAITAFGGMEGSASTESSGHHTNDNKLAKSIYIQLYLLLFALLFLSVINMNYKLIIMGEVY